MAIEPTAPAAPQIQVRVVGQFVKDLSFESPNVAKLMSSPAENPNLNLEMNVEPASLGKDIFEI